MDTLIRRVAKRLREPGGEGEQAVERVRPAVVRLPPAPVRHHLSSTVGIPRATEDLAATSAL